jgi:hypothetical protein
LFEFRVLSAGTYRLEARAGGALASGGGTNYYPTEIPDIILADNQARDAMRVVISMGGGFIVRVRDKNNSPLNGAQITAYEEGTGSGNVRGGVRGRTNGEGEAVLNGIKPGVYTLLVQARQMGQQASGGFYVSPGQFTTANLTLEAGFNVSVRLTDQNGQPANGANITLRNAQGSRLSIRGGGRNNSNVYSLGTLAPGKYTVEASWKGGSGSAGFNVSNNGPIPVKLK